MARRPVDLDIRDTKVFHAKNFGGKAEKQRLTAARRNIERHRKLQTEAQSAAEATSVLLPNEAGFIETDDQESSHLISQQELLEQVDVGTKKKAYSLQLSHGPYHLDYTRDGRFLCLGGDKGQLAMFDAIAMKPFFDISVKQTVRDVQFLDNEEMIAVAQKKYVHIYDNHGVEIYCLRDLTLTYQLQYMAPFWLLVLIGEFGELSWQDVTSGEIVARYKTHRGPCKVMRQNPNNGVIHLGHNDGTVTLWTPNEGKPAVELLAHKGPLVSMAVHNNYMVTSGFDGLWNTWDLRNYQKVLHRQFTGRTPPTAMAVSQTGILGMALGSRIEYFKDVFRHGGGVAPSLYLRHQFPSEQVKDMHFQNYEDICAVGKSTGISTLIVPGSGIANFDAYAPNPYESSSKKQVQRMLDKIPYDTITTKNIEIGSYNRGYIDAVAAEAPKAVDSGAEVLKNKRKKRKPMKASTAKKVAQYERTFQRRQQAVKDRLQNLKKKKLQSPEKKESIIEAMTFEDSTGERRIRGPVRGAALSRFVEKG